MEAISTEIDRQCVKINGKRGEHVKSVEMNCAFGQKHFAEFQDYHFSMQILFAFGQKHFAQFQDGRFSPFYFRPHVKSVEMNCAMLYTQDFAKNTSNADDETRGNIPNTSLKFVENSFHVISNPLCFYYLSFYVFFCHI
jgi:hypothetical protein